MTVAVTGADGFVGRNLVLRLKERGCTPAAITRGTPTGDAQAAIANADIVFHLAGANRPGDDADYMRDNRDYSAFVADSIVAGGRRPLVIHASSAKAGGNSEYGRSKLAGEEILLRLAERDATVSVWRLPNLFGKWTRPNYNSVIATFCHNAARGLPIEVHDPAAPLSLLYIDDLIDQWLALLDNRPQRSGIVECEGTWETTVGEVARLIEQFADTRKSGVVGDVGVGLSRALYATFVAALPKEEAAYSLNGGEDERGMFVELVKTAVSGQFSYFTAHPGVTRGGHFHHSKVEKFVVAQGEGLFRFRHVLNGESFELTGSADRPSVIETIPGWSHDVTNVGETELVVLVWANEQFDPSRPDTVSAPL